MTSDERLYALRVDIYDEISYHLGIDDSDDGACDAKNAAANAILRLIERELGDAVALVVKIEAAWDWIYRTEPNPELNGDLLRGLRIALSGGDGSGQWHEFTENINDASMCVCGVPDLGHDVVYPPRPHCADCHRPLPHTEPEQRACGKGVDA